jgi:1,4-dihydroxy-2-naphthoate octaprenyltransferase
VTDGLILLGVLAVIFAIFVARGRKRLGMGFTGRSFAMAVCGFAIVVLILWVAQRH